MIQATCQGRVRRRQHGTLSLAATRGWAWVHAPPVVLTGPYARSTVLCATGEICEQIIPLISAQRPGFDELHV